MNRKWLGVTALIVCAGALLSSSSCARSQQLVSISVTPSTVTFQGVGAQVQFTAVGTYIHPPENKDVTNLAAWSIDSQNLVTFNSTPGNVTAISDCGTGNVMASIQDGGNYVYGTAFVSASGVGTPVCNQAVLTVVVAGNGSVTSAPAGINCPSSACSAGFPLDQGVVLTATLGSGSSVVTWTWPSGTAGCTNPAGSTTCNVALDTNETITATFQ
ncbi:MAG TPA: hypothetical protein VMD99_02325 [Terriglobales bacterium]|nr:hypothetical protein [Terriglobales bacterium]